MRASLGGLSWSTTAAGGSTTARPSCKSRRPAPKYWQLGSAGGDGGGAGDEKQHAKLKDIPHPPVLSPRVTRRVRSDTESKGVIVNQSSQVSVPSQLLRSTRPGHVWPCSSATSTTLLLAVGLLPINAVTQAAGGGGGGLCTCGVWVCGVWVCGVW